MAVPDLQGVVQCSYCGTKIVLPPTEVTKERRNLERYRELCRAEKQAKNWKNVLKYADEILEIDPKDVDAWIDKALAAGSLSFYLIPRLDEALGYLNNASELSPDDARVPETRNLVRDVLFDSYVQQAVSLNRQAQEVNNMGPGLRDHAAKYASESMGYLLLAHRIKPDDPVNLRNVKEVSDSGRSLGLQWNQEVQDVLRKIAQLDARQVAMSRLSTLRNKLNQRQAELAKLNHQKKGFFVNMEIEDVGNEIKKISLEIGKLEKATRG